MVYAEATMAIAMYAAEDMVTAMMASIKHDRGCAYTNAREEASARHGGEGAG